MPEFVMTVGLPASGKSTFFEMRYKHRGYVHISSDSIREEVFNDVNDQSHNEEVFKLMEERTISSLCRGTNVYYDATNLSAKRRRVFLEKLRSKKAGIENLNCVCWIFVPPIEECKRRNSLRERKVPEYVIDRMLRHFEVPFYNEGWDEIGIKESSRSSQSLSQILDDNRTIPHYNPHHSLTIYEHMYQAGRLAQRYYPNNIEVQMAAQFHDIGKWWTQVFHNAKGNPTEIAHYYDHEKVGAYIYLSHSLRTRQDLYIANLISHHMDFFKGDKYIERMRNRFGEDFVANLEKLHKCDVDAH